jgi:hypothetical protein
MRIGGTATAVALAVMLSACGQPDYVTDSSASVLLLVVEINEGAVLDSDVRLGADSNLVCPDNVDVTLSVRNKNPTLAGGSQGDVLLTQYEVLYRRTDGAEVEGVNVPHTIRGVIASSVEVDNTVTVPLEVVRRQAKLEPPLSAMTGFDIMTVIAEITMSGETVSGESVSATGRLQIDFANYGDDNNSCPSEG